MISGDVDNGVFSKIRLFGLSAFCLILITSGCSVKRMAINELGNALASDGTTFATDDDPEFVKAAVPFSLKLMESLLAESPEHKELLLATSKGFTQYSYAFIKQEADELEGEDLTESLRLRDRARRLFIRGRDYGLRALEANYPGILEALWNDPVRALQQVQPKDVAILYWTAASWGSVISLSKNDPYRIGELPQVEALIDRALELDETYEDGAIHSFLISYEMTRAGAPGDPVARSRQHFERAVELSNGQQAGPYVSYAEAVAVKQQDLELFDQLLQKALLINPDDIPETRLINLIMQRRARWLVSERENLFLIPTPTL